MKDCYKPVSRLVVRGLSLRLAATAALLSCVLPSARADIVGRIHVTVTDAATQKPIAKASVTFNDTAGVRADIVMSTDSDGTVLSPLLENHAWEIDTSADGYADDSRSVTVITDVTSEVSVALSAKQETLKNGQPVDSTQFFKFDFEVQ